MTDRNHLDALFKDLIILSIIFDPIILVLFIILLVKGMNEIILGLLVILVCLALYLVFTRIMKRKSSKKKEVEKKS